MQATVLARGDDPPDPPLLGGPIPPDPPCLALLVILALFGAGFALHVLWWIAVAAVVIFLVGFFFRR